jgi:hypothetical protein
LVRVEQLHWVRDVTFAEDASQVRAGTAPRVPWPPCATSLSVRCAWPGRPTAPPRCDTTAATRPGLSPTLASLPHETDITPQRRRLRGLRVWTVARQYGSTSALCGQLGIALRVRSGLDFVKGADDHSGRARSRS